MHIKIAEASIATHSHVYC